MAFRWKNFKETLTDAANVSENLLKLLAINFCNSKNLL